MRCVPGCSYPRLPRRNMSPAPQVLPARTPSYHLAERCMLQYTGFVSCTVLATLRPAHTGCFTSLLLLCFCRVPLLCTLCFAVRSPRSSPHPAQSQQQLAPHAPHITTLCAPAQPAQQQQMRPRTAAQQLGRSPAATASCATSRLRQQRQRRRLSAGACTAAWRTRCRTCARRQPSPSTLCLWGRLHLWAEADHLCSCTHMRR